MPEASIAAAELREVLEGRLTDNRVTYPLAPFLEGAPLKRYVHFKRRFRHLKALDDDDDLPGTFEATQYCRDLVEAHGSPVAAEAVRRGNVGVLSWMTGLTQQDIDASALTLPVRLLNEMENDGAPAFLTAAGNPNTGKTNTAIKLIEMRKLQLDDLLVLSNVRSWKACDIHVTSAHDLVVQLLEHRETPKAVLIDEASTHFDARTYRQEIATQYTPLAKRYAKVGVDLECVVVHTGKDLHPERKRLSTLAFYKEDKETAQFFAEWTEDSDRPTDQLFSGSIVALEEAEGYDPDDAAPWSWDLAGELFTCDLSWSELLDELGAISAEK